MESIPACDSDGGCKTNTASPWKQRGDPIYEVPNFPAPTPLPPLPKHSLVDINDENLLQSDPICTSAGCSQYLHPAKHDDWPRDYSVPNFGIDRDISVTQANSAASGEFDPSNVAPDSYENGFDLSQAGTNEWQKK